MASYSTHPCKPLYYRQLHPVNYQVAHGSAEVHGQ